MTKHMIPTADRRAQIFALLRDTSAEEPDTTPTRYLEESVADQMIARAVTSFKAPAVVVEPFREKGANANARPVSSKPRVSHIFASAAQI